MIVPDLEALAFEATSNLMDLIYGMLTHDPHTAVKLSIDQIVLIVDDLIEGHGDYLPEYH